MKVTEILTSTELIFLGDLVLIDKVFNLVQRLKQLPSLNFIFLRHICIFLELWDYHYYFSLLGSSSMKLIYAEINRKK